MAASAAIWLLGCSLRAWSAAGASVSSGSGERRPEGEARLQPSGEPGRRAVLVQPGGEVDLGPAAPRRAVIRSVVQAAARGALAEEAPGGALLEEEEWSGEGCEGEEEVNPGEFSRKYSTIWDDDAVGNGHARSMLGSEQAWSAKNNQANEWMQIDLDGVKRIGGVVTQGRNNYNQWVTRFRVMVSKDGGNWDDVGLMSGNGDQSTKVVNKFSEPKYGKHVRFMVQDWFLHVSMRAAVLTCKDTTTTTTSTTTTTTKTTVVKAGAWPRRARGAGAVLAALLALWVAEQP